MLNLTQHTPEINRLLSRYGVKFGIYKNNSAFTNSSFPSTRSRASSPATNLRCWKRASSSAWTR